jgi:hypothetical protein
MKVALTTLSNHLYSESRALLCSSALLNGIEEVYDYDFEDIRSTSFFSKNVDILSNTKFMGYWLWKPYIILEVLKKLSKGDILLYIDAGIKVIDVLNPVIDICKNHSDIVVCGNGNDINASWTKRDCFTLMECDSERFWYAPHCDASFMVFKHTSKSLDFLNQWLAYGSNKNIISDSANICGLENRPEYVDHRYDQSILSVLAEKFELDIYRTPSQFGNHYKMRKYRVDGEFNCVNQMNQSILPHYHFLPYHNSPYGQLLNHHRTRNIGFESSSSWNSGKIDNKEVSDKSSMVSIMKKYLRKVVR